MASYTTWTDAQLVQAAQRRGLNVQCPRSRQSYLDALHLADADPKSLFCLPKELRMEVFQHLLLFQPHTKEHLGFPVLDCHPQILASCKFINQEATGILYDENVFEVSVYRTGVPSRSRWSRNDQFHGDRFIPTSPYRRAFNAVAGTPFLGEPGFERDMHVWRWGRHLLRAKKVLVKVEFDAVEYFSIDKSPLRARDYFPLSFHVVMNHLLYSLCSFFAGRHCIKHFDLDLRLAGWVTPVGLTEPIAPRRLERVLAPLTMLGVCENITIRMSDTTTLQLSSSRFAGMDARIRAGIDDLAEDPGVLPAALALAEEAEAYHDLAEMAWVGQPNTTMRMPFSGPVVIYPADWKRLFEAEEVLLRTINNSRSYHPVYAWASLLHTAWEYQMREATKRVQDALDDLDVCGILRDKGQGYGDVLQALRRWREERMATRLTDPMQVAAQSMMDEPIRYYDSDTAEGLSAYDYREKQLEPTGIPSPLTILVTNGRSWHARGLRSRPVNLGRGVEDHSDEGERDAESWSDVSEAVSEDGGWSSDGVADADEDVDPDAEGDIEISERNGSTTRRETEVAVGDGLESNSNFRFVAPKGEMRVKRVHQENRKVLRRSSRKTTERIVSPAVLGYSPPTSYEREWPALGRQS